MNTTHAMRLPRLVLAAMILLCGAGLAAQKKDKEGGGKEGDKPKAEPHAVVQVGDEIRVVKKTEMKAITKEIDDEHKKALEEYDDAKKAAAKEKKKFAAPKPVKKQMKVLQPNCKTREEAEKFLADQQAKDAKKKEKEADKEGDEDAPEKDK